MSTQKQMDEMLKFFELLDEAITPFKSGYKMPNANAGDSRVSIAAIKGKPMAKFEFLVAGNKHIAVKIDIMDIASNPEEYIANMLELIDQGITAAKKEDRIFIPPAIAQSHMMGIK